MAKSLPDAAAPARLRAALTAFRERGIELDQGASAVLDRLAASDLAADAVAGMTEDPDVILRIVRRCLDCELHCRRFFQDVSAERAMPERLNGLATAAREMDRFVEELAAGPPHRLAGYVALETGEGDYLRIALGRIAGLIEGRRRVAAETPLRLGATNKLDGGDETAAIGWLAEGIKAIMGRPHYQHVARLAEVVLNVKDISADRVREALRTRHERDWQRR